MTEAYTLAILLVGAGLLRVSDDYWIFVAVAVFGSLLWGQLIAREALEDSFATATRFIAFVTAYYVGARLLQYVKRRQGAVGKVPE